MTSQAREAHVRSLGGTTCWSIAVSVRTITGRSALFRHVANLRHAGEYDFDLLQIARSLTSRLWTNCMTTDVRESRQIRLWPNG